MGDIKRFDLNNIIRNCNTKTFCETGTLLGDGVAYACTFPFDTIISLEIMTEYVQKARDRFKTDMRVHIVEGDTSIILPNVLEKINTNCVFWLDAHFPGADLRHKKYTDEKNKDTRTPLKRELSYIQQRVDKFDDVIIIDDLWIYEEGPFEWGTFNEHMKRCHNGERREDICGEDSSFIYNLFKDTHHIKKLNNDQGYLILIPQKYESKINSR